LIGEPVDALTVADLRALDPAGWLAELGRLGPAEAARPFDLQRGPLLRALLLLGPPATRESVLLIALHHIVTDGWSMGVLVRELGELIAARLTGRESALPPLPVQYADYAVWQRRWLTGAVLDEQLAWWRERLAGAPPQLDLPTDRPRGRRFDPRGAVERFALRPAVVRRLQGLARTSGATLFMALLAGWAAVLRRWSGEDDLTVGTPNANRRRPEIEGLIGFFVNTLVMRADLGGNPSFTVLLRRMREMALGAFAHADLPFERLVEELRPERSLASTPLFQVLLVLQNTPAPRVDLTGLEGRLELEVLPLPGGTANFDLSLNLIEAADGSVGGSLTYRAALFDATTVRRLLGHLGRLLEGAAEKPGRRLSELPLLGEEERQRLLRDWTEAPVGAGIGEPTPVHRRISAWAARTPQAVAVVAGEERLTFGELERRAASVAASLRECGIGLEERVGLLASRSAGMLAGMLGIWQAGAAWVPLDPSHPEQRRALTVRDAGIRWIVADGEIRELAPAAGGEARAAAPSTDDPRLAAYVLYTSGSTGTPKGVVVEHGALAAYLEWTAGLLGERALPAVTSLSFDASLKQLLTPLLAGRPVHLLPEAALEPGALLDAIAAGGYAALNMVPSLWHALLERIEEGEGPRLRVLSRLLLGGEALDADLAERTLRAFPEAELWNLYGPTEATANATATRIQAGDPITLGSPLPGLRTVVLDADGSLAPLGAFGELCLGDGGGGRLARGYLGRPGLTAERFVPDSFSADPGARLYRTGDLVRHLADGRLEYRGRTDHQVKVRGVRIELGEIEARLAAHPAVRETAVVARAAAPGPGDIRLIAWVVPRPEESASSEALRAWLTERLPLPLVPAEIRLLDALPRTPTGKLDRRALAERAAADPLAAPGRAFVAPRDAVEQALAALWEEVLGVERVGVRDNFFALGGHSLLAARLLSRIRRDLDVEIPLRTLFETPDLEALARVVLAARLEEVDPGALSALLAELESLSDEDALAGLDDVVGETA
jgi:amino acid adenylation domain-containing protein